MKTSTEIISRTIDKWEGCAYTTDPNDPGKGTKFGISEVFNPGIDIEHLTREQAIAIYEFKYYQPLRLDEITNDSLRWKIFDMNVNPGHGARRVQVCLNQLNPGIIVDGIIGENSLRAINQTDPQLLMTMMIEDLTLHYKALVQESPVKQKYLKGWLNRARDFAEEWWVLSFPGIK